MIKQAFDIKKIREDLEKMSPEEFAKNHTLEEMAKFRAKIHDKELQGRISKAFIIVRSGHH